MLLSEKNLLEGIGSKDRKMFYLLYKQYYAALVVYAVRFLGNKEEAEDVVQDVLIALWEKREPFENLQLLVQFLYTSVRNRSLNVLKHRVIREKYDRYCQEDFREEIDAEEEIMQREALRMLWQLIDELPPRCQEVFLLHMDGHKNEEIAVALNIALDTVKNQKKKAVAQLKKRMGSLFMILVSAGIV